MVPSPWSLSTLTNVISYEIRQTKNKSAIAPVAVADDTRRLFFPEQQQELCPDEYEIKYKYKK